MNLEDPLFARSEVLCLRDIPREALVNYGDDARTCGVRDHTDPDAPCSCWMRKARQTLEDE